MADSRRVGDQFMPACWICSCACLVNCESRQNAPRSRVPSSARVPSADCVTRHHGLRRRPSAACLPTCFLRRASKNFRPTLTAQQHEREEHDERNDDDGIMASSPISTTVWNSCAGS